MAGWRNTNARNTALVTAGIGIVAYFPLQAFFDGDISLWVILGLGLVAIGVGVAVGYAMGGFDKGQSARTGAVTALPDVGRHVRRPGDAVVGRVLGRRRSSATGRSRRSATRRTASRARSG